jgi:hypothetical protein
MLFYEFGFELRRIYDLGLYLLGPNADFRLTRWLVLLWRRQCQQRDHERDAHEGRADGNLPRGSLFLIYMCIDHCPSPITFRKPTPAAFLTWHYVGFSRTVSVRSAWETARVE